MAEVGYGLLSLSYLVKWVRSDTELDPFSRSQQLSLEAVETFRSTSDDFGLARALIAASALAGPDERYRNLQEAERIAEARSDELLGAMVMAARARMRATPGPEAAIDLNLKALEVFREHGDMKRAAGCLFSLSITHGTSAEKRAYAEEAADIYRSFGDPDEAARCMMIAFMNAEEVAPVESLEPLAKRGLQDALDGGNRSMEGYFYEKLSTISDARGNSDEAARYQKWAEDIRESDGLTPLERWEQEVEMTRQMIEFAGQSESREVVEAFEQRLKELLDNPPS